MNHLTITHRHPHHMPVALTEAVGEAVQQIVGPALTKHYNKTLPHVITADVVQRMPKLTNRVSVYLARLLLEVGNDFCYKIGA